MKIHFVDRIELYKANTLHRDTIVTFDCMEENHFAGPSRFDQPNDFSLSSIRRISEIENIVLLVERG